MNIYNKKYKFLIRVILVLVDIISITIALWVAQQIRYRGIMDILDQRLVLQLYILNIVVALVYNSCVHGYARFMKRGFIKETGLLLALGVVLEIVGGFYMFAIQQGLNFSRLVLVYSAGLSVAIIWACRMIIKPMLRNYFRKSKESEKFVIVTTTKEVQNTLEHIKRDNPWSYHVDGIVFMDCKNGDYSAISSDGFYEGYPIIADKESVFDVLRQTAVDAVLIDCPDMDLSQTELVIQSVLAMGVVCHNCIHKLNVEAPKSSFGNFAGLPVMSYSMNLFDYRSRMIKRLFDVFVGIIGLLITIIITPFIALAIYINDPGPIFFGQTRIGKNGRRFKMYKFRSMYVDAEERKKELMAQNEMKGLMFKMENDPRITKVGAFLRKTSLDELPQFWNILIGEMSLVGTRPPTVDEFEQYNIYYRRRLSITPGLTGMWQVSGRSDITDFDDIVRLDLQYIDNWSLMEDLEIIIKTFGVVLLRKGSK